ncbi:MAG: hypothetical protein U5K84_11395 [Alkalibacterium sp.]|nr:hypothetical protein [Alkalibacterium sp.]
MNRLSDRLKRLPLVTMETLSELSDVTTADTTLFFRHALDSMKEQPG